MFYDETKAIEKCEEEPSQIFKLIDEGHLDLFEKMLRKKWFNVNTINENGDDLVTYLLRKNHFDLVEKLMKKKEWNVNNQNNEGNTFAHVVATKNHLDVLEITKTLSKNKQYIPNIRNKRGQTILDIAIENGSTYTTVKILEDERFNNIDLVSFKNLYENYIKNNDYGIYSKLSNLDTIIDNLKEKELLPKLNKIIDTLNDDIKEIKELVKNNDIKTLDNIIYSALN